MPKQFSSIGELKTILAIGCQELRLFPWKNAQPLLMRSEAP